VSSSYSRLVRLRRRPLVAVVGPTGTGKSGVALALARAFDGEVIGADAYQLYRGLDIGTAKLPLEQRAGVPHHLVDVADPDDAFTLARYVEAALQSLESVWQRGRLPVLAGGSGQYVWAVLEGWQVPRVPPDPALRAELEAFAREHGPEALHARLARLDPETASRLDPRNSRRVARALEVVASSGRPLAACQARTPLDADVFILGLRLPRQELYRRLDERTDAMFAASFLDEVRRLRAAGYGDTAPVRGGIGYKEVSLYLDGELTLAEAVERMKNANHRLVRRQHAWFRPSDGRIHWLDAAVDASRRAVEVVAAWLAEGGVREG
jgi:tRNA dimethylallyltransferase